MNNRFTRLMNRLPSTRFGLHTKRLLGRYDTTFTCNLCGHEAYTRKADLTREQPTCGCGSTVRTRALVHHLSLQLFGKSLPIPRFPIRRDIVGVDMSGALVYANPLADRIGYTNTFLHKPPRLDITKLGDSWIESCDFVVSSDVFEHVAPPVQRAFDNTFRLLKPNGVFIFTVPFTDSGETVEHFPDLYDYRIVRRGGAYVLQNNTADGRRQEYEHLVFHGGEGETLEMRVFSQSGVLRNLESAGFTDIRIHGEAFPAYGIVWPQAWSLPITARRPDPTAESTRAAEIIK